MADCGKLLYDPDDANLALVHDPDDSSLALMFKDEFDLLAFVSVWSKGVFSMGTDGEALGPYASEAALWAAAEADMLAQVAADNTYDLASPVIGGWFAMETSTAPSDTPPYEFDGYKGRLGANLMVVELRIAAHVSRVQALWPKLQRLKLRLVADSSGVATGQTPNPTHDPSAVEWRLRWALAEDAPANGAAFAAALDGTETDYEEADETAIEIDIDPADAAWTHDATAAGGRGAMVAHLYLMAYPKTTGFGAMPATEEYVFYGVDLELTLSR